MHHPLTSRFPHFLLPVLLCGLIWYGLERVSVADLNVLGDNPTIFFDDDNTGQPADWAILGDNVFGFGIYDIVYGTRPFNIAVGAPSSSLDVNSSGNIGVGTSTPAQKLHLSYGSFTGGIRLEQNSGLGLSPRTWDLIGNNLNFFIQDVSAPQFTAPFVVAAGAPHFGLVLSSNGRVGLSTNAPEANLHIAGKGDPNTAQPTQDIFSGIGPHPGSGPAFNFGYSGASFGRSSGFFNVRPDASAVAPNPSLRFLTANVQRLIITNTGQVGIGTTSPGVALDVVGTVRASTSLMVGITTLSVPDYVFAPDYPLMPLPAVAAYVEKEKHLPDLPSAQEMKEQGVNVGALQMQLLRKVEELTLYILEQQKTIERLNERLSVLESDSAGLNHGSRSERRFSISVDSHR